MVDLTAGDVPIAGTDSTFTIQKVKRDVDDHARHIFTVSAGSAVRFMEAFKATGLSYKPLLELSDEFEQVIAVDSGDTRRVLQSVLSKNLIGQTTFIDTMRDLGASRQLAD